MRFHTHARIAGMCTFVGYFDGKNAFRLRFHHREYGGVVPKTRVIYCADLERKNDTSRH